MPRNVELKARLKSLDAAREVAQRVAGRYVGRLDQVDTYFHVPSNRGRLKLRETNGQTAELIAYQRPDETQVRVSEYRRIPLTADTASELKTALAAALGVRQVVTKRRELFLQGDVRIHLDEVQALGAFLEFEAVLGKSDGENLNEPDARRRVDALAKAFGITAADRIASSYGDLAESSPLTT